MEKLKYFLELFPGKWSCIIFILYIFFFVNQGLLITWSQKDGEYQYNIVTVVLLTEVVKLIASSLLYCKKNSFSSLCPELLKHKKVLLLYMVPSSLYCIYNNLSFINLAALDAPTYYLFLQFRVVITGIIFQIVFKKYLSIRQWISLIILTFGCMIKHVNLDYKAANIFSKLFYENKKIYLVFIQSLCSCLASVYNEYLLKGEGKNVNIFTQNIFMYIDSILFNFAFLVTQDDFMMLVINSASKILINFKVLLVIINNAAIGIITSFFLKNLNSILKTFASALELVITTILCWVIFDIPIYLNTILSIVIVIYAIILYSLNPVQNVQPKIREDDSFELKQTLIIK